MAEKYVVTRFILLLLLTLVGRGVCIELHTTNVLEGAKIQCPISAKSIYTVPSEMQCYQRCLRKEKCEILNYKESSTKENCEVFDVASGDSDCTETQAVKWKTTVLKRKKEQKPKVYETCKEIKNDNPSVSSGVYQLRSGKHYCIMDNLQGCGEGGWTLAMKIDGSKNTFKGTSSYWEDNNTYNVENGLKSLENEEAKFPAFSSIAFTSICLGMKRNGVKKWVHISKTEASLLQVFKGANYQSTSLGRAKWMSLIDGSSLQPYCNREGFNVKPNNNNNLYVRIGLLGNQENDCNSPDSFLGFGGRYSSFCNGALSPISCGNIATCSTNNKSLAVMGFLLIK